MPILVLMRHNQLTVIYNSTEIDDNLFYNALSWYTLEVSYKNYNSIRAVTISGDYVDLYSFLYQLTLNMVNHTIKIF